MERMTETQREAREANRREKKGGNRGPGSERPQEHNVRQPDNEVSLSDSGPRVSILIDVHAHRPLRVHTLHILMHTVAAKSLGRARFS